MDGAKRYSCYHNLRLAAYLVWITIALVGPSHSQDIVSGSPGKGAQLIDRLCSNCHVSDNQSRSAVPAGIPTLRGIANKPGQTGMHIVGVLMAPHAPMPNIGLSRDEIGDVVAYLQTLRTDRTLPPFLPVPQEQSPKPKYPEPT